MNLDMIKKTRRNPNSIESSSSEATEQSKPPKDVLGLGRHLVRELKLKDRGDTLGLWMAQHVAELIKAAEKEKSPAKRKRAKREATETILKIWEHRESIPSYAFPLARYEDLFKVLDRLLPSDNPFQYGQDFGTRTDQLAASLFHNLSQLIICLLLMKPLSLDTAEPVDQAALDALSEEERHVWNALQKWLEIFLPKTDSKQQAQAKEAQPEHLDIDWKEIARDLVTRIEGSAEELQAELSKPDVESSSLSTKGKKTSPKRGRKRARNK